MAKDSGLSEYPKYTRHDIFCTEDALFRDVDIGNFFFIGDEMYVRMNYPKDRLFPRNAVIILSPRPGMCGLGIYLDSHDKVEIVTESSITLKGEHKS
jgi:hypothetical protein